MKINIFFRTLLTFWPDFYFIIFMTIFCTQKMLMCILFLGGEGEGVSESVWFVH